MPASGAWRLSPQPASTEAMQMSFFISLLEPSFVTNSEHAGWIGTRSVRAARDDHLLVEQVRTRGIELRPRLEADVCGQIDREQRLREHGLGNLALPRDIATLTAVPPGRT